MCTWAERDVNQGKRQATASCRRWPVFCALLCMASCVRSYHAVKPLAFHELPYRSLAGRPWALSWITLDDVARRYAMPRPPRIAYVELNAGAPRAIVFVHGMTAYISWWRHQLDYFAARGYRVIALDLPGYGKSDKPASFPYTMEAMGDVVHELARRKKLSKPILVGHSMGGHALLSLAIRFPDLPGALILTQSAGLEYFSKREQAWFRKVYNTRLLQDRPEYLEWGSFRYFNFYRWRDEHAWIIEERIRLSKSAKAFEQHLYAMVKSVHGMAPTEFVRENLDKITAPTLIIYGDKDRLIPNPVMHGGTTRSVMQYGHQHVRASTLRELPGCGHTVQIDCAEAYNAAVLSWLGSITLAPTVRVLEGNQALQPTRERRPSPASAPATPNPPPATAPANGSAAGAVGASP